MSNFYCPVCRTPCIDSTVGYITGCDHHPASEVAINYYNNLADSDNLTEEQEACIKIIRGEISVK